MAKNLIEGGPSEGELVVAVVREVKQNGAYVDIDEYDGIEGFIFIGEIASGWVKNIRAFVRPGQRLICKVLRTRKDNKSLELSLKSVSEERKRDRLAQWKNEERAKQLLKVLAEQVGWSEDELAETQMELTESYATLYGAFEEAAKSPESLEEVGFEGDWIAAFIEIAVKNIIPDTVVIRGRFVLNVDQAEGIDVIKEALIAAENISNEESELIVTCHYDGAPSYRIDLKAPDFKTAEEAWDNATTACIEIIQNAGGSAEAERD
ncbi:MAG: translation initiation factor IF-2 subunit alpha [Euryarchaeota archaeon]|jgi:translation initiation factor 2 subunit 1|nr:translation initiation factor IF-2 subunit alpha [Euryarchaeota archaeon]MBT7244268.1 translation initiation factor IF-2 subunit alpha [Euryarchaeota archaeon]